MVTPGGHGPGDDAVTLRVLVLDPFEPLDFLGLLRLRVGLLPRTDLQTLRCLPLPMEGKILGSHRSRRAFLDLILRTPNRPDLGVPQYVDRMNYAASARYKRCKVVISGLVLFNT